MFMRFLGVSVTYLVVFVGTAKAFNYFIQDGFGSGDFIPLLIWGTPSILINCLILTILLRFLDKKPGSVTLAIKFAAFFILPFAGVYSYLLLLGPWFGAMSVPPMPPHLAATLTVLCLRGSKSIKGMGINGLIAAGAVILFGILFSPTIKMLNVALLSGGNVPFSSSLQVEKKMNTAEVIQHYCPNNPPTINEIENANSKSDIVSGRICHIDTLKFLLSFYKTTGLVFQPPLWHRQTLSANFKERLSSVLLLYEKEYSFPDTGVSLPVPKSGSIIYYMKNGDWVPFPNDSATTNREVRLSSSYQERNGEREPILCVSISDYFGNTRGANCAGVLPRNVKLYLEK